MDTKQKEIANDSSFESILEELRRQTGELPLLQDIGDQPVITYHETEKPPVEKQEEQPVPPPEPVKNKKLEQFLNESTQNIYSSAHSAHEKQQKQLLFGTATVHIEKQKSSVKQVVDTTETHKKKVRQYQQFKKQRDQIASQFELEQEPEPVKQPEPEPQVFENEQEFNLPADAQRVKNDLIVLGKSLKLKGIALTVLSLLSLYMVVAGRFELPIPEMFTVTAPIAFLITNLVLLLGAMGVVYTTVIFGLKGINKLKMNRDSLPVVTAVVCVVQILIMLVTKGKGLIVDGNAFVLAPLAIVGLAFNCFAKQMMSNRTLANFKFVSSQNYDQYSTGMMMNEDMAELFTRGIVPHKPYVAYNRKTNFLTDFMYYSFLEDITDHFAFYLVPIGVGLSLVLGFITTIMSGSFANGLTAFTASMCICSPISYLYAVNLPLQRATNKLAKVSSVMLSYEATEEFGNLNAALTTARDLFPVGTVNMRGMKTFYKQPIDQSILDAASVLYASNSVLRDIFMKVILDREDILKKVDNVVFEDGLGVSAWVDNRRVLIGSREMMVNHNIVLPSEEEERFYCPDGLDLVYVATSGLLCAAFMFTIQGDGMIRESIDTLIDNDIYLVVQTVDPVITKEKLSELFGIEQEVFKILPARFHAEYRKQAGKTKRACALLSNNGKFYSYVQSIVTAKRLKPSVLIAMTLSLASMVLGLVIICVFGAINGMAQFDVFAMLLYELGWASAVWLLPMLRNI